jgi:hypothetical protein
VRDIIRKRLKMPVFLQENQRVIDCALRQKTNTSKLQGFCFTMEIVTGGPGVSDATFFISHDGKPQGPWTKQIIRQKLSKSELLFTDYIWSVDEESWNFLAAFFVAEFPAPKEPPPGIKAKVKEAQPLREFSGHSFAQEVGISNESIWFLYKDKSKFGPYRYLELVSLLQKNACTPEDFIWKPGFDDWQRIRLTPEFTDEILKKLAHMKSFAVDKVIIQRRFPRVPYDAEVIIHDDLRVMFGSATKISEGGAFLEVDKPTHQKGDRLKLHFTPGGVRVPFNCIAEVITVSKAKPLGYSVKFIYLEEGDRKRIAEFADTESGDKK